jgi:hypothetical protein
VLLSPWTRFRWSGLLLSSVLYLAHGFTFGSNGNNAVCDPIRDGIGYRSFPKVLLPGRDG